MSIKYQRRPKGKSYIPITVRYSPETYEQIRKYAYDKNMSMALANEELILKGLRRA